ncbi:MAG TPA: DUF1990 family protein [Nocardioides sp.]|uniref:DUF1990 family protein n=1 Tax=Nocardioides sp. TaxID=35761 RepID=UPI002F3EB2CA
MARARLSLGSLMWRWGLGMALVTWRYVWSITPLHRVQARDSRPRRPPAVPAGVSTSGLQGSDTGSGPLFHRLFRAEIAGARHDAAALVDALSSDFERFVPREVVRVHQADSDGVAAVGDDLVVDMPGPWNGPVRVLVAEPGRLRLGTLEGHLEAGQIEFRATDGDPLVFEIEVWARAADWKVRALYTHLRLAKEIQLNMWVRVCGAAARLAGGRLVDGVEIRTTTTPP